MESPLQPEDTQKREAYLQESLDHTSKAFGYKFDATPVSTEQSTVKSVIAKYLTPVSYTHLGKRECGLVLFVFGYFLFLFFKNFYNKVVIEVRPK